ncbi:hypothetical protein A4X09_0g1712 [Tilletia walkeri]|uniref:Thioesterase/thiol ester dehydrase-isomerase n=1 Tax=Tilletia walkeri TaxID=117179 RepID=A0A8X7T6H2_9BASI|nr:hypothetical protein A4X09_0g1712 [Tilletia walkeri]
MPSSSRQHPEILEKVPMPETLLDIISIRRIPRPQQQEQGSASPSPSSDSDSFLYETTSLPWSFGYGRRAFGGTTLAVCVQAAYTSLLDKMGPEAAEAYTLYSFQGSFLSPTKITDTLRIRVTPIRDSRSFVTRVVQGFQYEENGDERNTFIATADFVRRGQPTVDGGTFSTIPMNPVTRSAWEAPETLMNVMDINALRRRKYDEGVKSGNIQPDPQVDRAITLESLLWSPISKLQEQRPLPTSPVNESITAFDVDRRLTQDGLSVTDKTTADYLRWSENPVEILRANPEGTKRSGWTLASLNACSLSLSLDYYLAGIALFHSKIPRHAALFVSLDFSLRFHIADIDATQWHLREAKAITGAQGRTFSEASVWAQKDGRLVATISQQCYCRPTQEPTHGGPAVVTISQSNPTDPNTPAPKEEESVEGDLEKDGSAVGGRAKL